MSTSDKLEKKNAREFRKISLDAACGLIMDMILQNISTRKELQLAKWLFSFRLPRRTLGWNGNNFGFIAQLHRRVFNKILRLNKHLTEFTIALALKTATLSDRTVWLIVIKRPRRYDLCRWLKLSTYRFARKFQNISKAGHSFFARSDVIPNNVRLNLLFIFQPSKLLQAFANLLTLCKVFFSSKLRDAKKHFDVKYIEQ